jgi:hypothetical protein
MANYFLSNENGEQFSLTPEGFIFGGENKINPGEKWRAVKLVHIVKTTRKLDIVHILTTSDGWEIYKRHERFKNGRSQWYLIDFDHGSFRRWGARIFLRKTN